MTDALLAWMAHHAAAVAATAFAVLILILCGLARLFSWWSEQRDRAEMVRHLKSIDQRAAELRRQARS